jgi:hypothetical protein
VRSLAGTLNVAPPAGVPHLIDAQGAVIGPSRIVRPDRLIYVVQTRYAGLGRGDRVAIARLVGAINRASAGRTVVALGPGRWGTRDPWLGVPVSFSEINRVAALCEIVAMSDNLIPDVSLGTHFLNELIEADMLYFALFPSRTGNRIDESAILGRPNRVLELLAQAHPLADVVHVVDFEPGSATLFADAEKQQVVMTCE